MKRRWDYLIIAVCFFIFAALICWTAFALPVLIHKDKSGSIVLQMQPFSIPTASVELDAKHAAVIGASKAKYIVIEYNAAGRVVDYVEANTYKEAEAAYLKQVLDRRKVKLAPMKVGKTKLEAGKVVDIKSVAVKPVIEP